MEQEAAGNLIPNTKVIIIKTMEDHQQQLIMAEMEWEYMEITITINQL